MSQHSAQSVVVRDTGNTLGVVGFVVSLVGLVVTGGLISPIGLILSLVAIGRQPRGFAIAGVILGLIGSCGLILVFVLAGAAVLAFIAALLGLAIIVALSETEKLEITSDMMNMAIEVALYEEENRYLPASLSLLGLKSTVLNDPWGNRYEYRLIEEDPGFDIISMGADGVLGTEDDIALTALGETWNPGGLGISVHEDVEGGIVTITLGDRELTATGDEDGGRVTINLGDRVLEIVGDEDGGHIEVKDSEDTEATAEDAAGDASVTEEPSTPQ